MLSIPSLTQRSPGLIYPTGYTFRYYPENLVGDCQVALMPEDEDTVFTRINFSCSIRPQVLLSDSIKKQVSLKETCCLAYDN